MANFIFHNNNAFFFSPIPCGDYLVYQIGEMYCKQDTVLTPHTQSCFEITFAVDGIGGCGSNTLLPLGANDGFLSFPDETHLISTDTTHPLRFHFLAFNPLPGSAGERYVSLLKEQAEELGRHTVHCPYLHTLLDMALEEVIKKDFISHEVIGLIISRLLIELLRAHVTDGSPHFSKEITSESMLVYHIIDYLETHVYTLKNLYELEEEFNYSYSYLSAIFRKIMSVTLNEFFKKTKMAEAKRLLDEGEKTVTQISELLNYSSIHTFSRSFRQHFGYSPTSRSPEEQKRA